MRFTKIVLFVLCMLHIPNAAYSVVCSTVISGTESCDTITQYGITWTLDTAYTVGQFVTVNGTTVLGETLAKGTSFIPTSSKKLSKVTLQVSSFNVGGEILCRVGENSDLTTYIEEATVEVTATGYTDIAYTATNTLNASTTYYLGCLWTTAQVTVHKDDSQTYTDGTMYYSTGTPWEMVNSATTDLIFRIEGR